MKVEYINPFIEGVMDMFTSMMGKEVRRGTVGLTAGTQNPREILAIIGLSGPAKGTVCLAFPTSTALSLVSQLLGQELRVVDATVVDGVAELVNIVAGGAKAKLSRADNAPIDLGLPTVVRGNNYTVEHPSGTQWLEVPFESDLGNFTLRVTFDFKKTGAK